MKKLLISLIISLLVLGAASCRKNPVEPEEKPEYLTPGRRDYTWVADTIKNPYLYFINIWGNSLTNIWTTGTLSSDALYKFDGTNWILDTRVYLPSPNALWGYGNKLWIGNYNGCIWQFVGNSFKEQISFLKLGDRYAAFLNMEGSDEKEIYADCSYYIEDVCYTMLMKYDGVSWYPDYKFEKPCGIMQLKYSSRNDKYYLTTSNYENIDIVYEYDRKIMKEIYRAPRYNLCPTLAVINGVTYIVIDRKVYLFLNNKLELTTEINDPNFGGVIWGRSKNDMFIRMFDGLAHYNGIDLQYLFKIKNNTKINAFMAIFEKDVFISVKDFNTGYSIIYHGKLN